jgi:hypothetical protein
MVLTNVLGPALLIRAALPALQQTRGGSSPRQRRGRLWRSGPPRPGTGSVGRARQGRLQPRGALLRWL